MAGGPSLAALQRLSPPRTPPKDTSLEGKAPSDTAAASGAGAAAAARSAAEDEDKKKKGSVQPDAASDRSKTGAKKKSKKGPHVPQERRIHIAARRGDARAQMKQAPVPAGTAELRGLVDARAEVTSLLGPMAAGIQQHRTRTPPHGAPPASAFNAALRSIALGVSIFDMGASDASDVRASLRGSADTSRLSRQKAPAVNVAAHPDPASGMGGAGASPAGQR